MQTVKEILNQNITIFEKDIDYKISNPGFGKNIVYEGVEMAAPLRQLITLIKFISNINSPHIVVRNFSSQIIEYNNEFSKFLQYLLMTGIKINFYCPQQTNLSKFFNFNIDIFKDNNLFIHMKNFDMDYWCKRLVNNLQYTKKSSIDINNLIFVTGEKDYNKILILSKNLIFINFESTLVDSIHYLKLMQQN